VENVVGGDEAGSGKEKYAKDKKSQDFSTCPTP
jgi:hypothetical protein